MGQNYFLREEQYLDSKNPKGQYQKIFSFFLRIFRRIHSTTYGFEPLWIRTLMDSNPYGHALMATPLWPRPCLHTLMATPLRPRPYGHLWIRTLMTTPLWPRPYGHTLMATPLVPTPITTPLAPPCTLKTYPTPLPHLTPPKSKPF